jgi:RNA polymerase sigma factor (sigma-70 family)
MDKKALERWIEENRDFIFRAAYKRTRHRQDAEDLTQDVLKEIAERTCEPLRSEEKSFLEKPPDEQRAIWRDLVRKRSIDRWRKAQRRIQAVPTNLNADLLSDSLPDQPSGQESVELERRLAETRELLKRFESSEELGMPRERSAVCMHYIDGRDRHAIGEQFGYQGKNAFKRGSEILRGGLTAFARWLNANDIELDPKDLGRL